MSVGVKVLINVKDHDDKVNTECGYIMRYMENHLKQYSDHLNQNLQNYPRKIQMGHITNFAENKILFTLCSS